VNDKFDVITELLSVEAMKSTTTVEDLYEKLSTTLERRKLSWKNLISMTADLSPNLTGKSVGLLKMVQDYFRETCRSREVLFFHSVVHLEVQPCEKHSCETTSVLDG
jgi:hypothetical protein